MGDTPAVRNAMPRFYEKMKNKLRTPEQGADTIVWLAISNNTEAIAPNKSGNFYQDRVSVSKHLPLAWSHSNKADENKLIRQLDQFCILWQNTCKHLPLTDSRTVS